MLEQIAGFDAVRTETEDRRSEDRTATVFRPVLIGMEEFAGFCLVRNLSAKGLMGQVYMQFAEGLAVLLQFTDEIVVPGTVVWSKDGRVGIRFDQQIDVEGILGALGKKTVGRKINRAPRLEIRCRGEVEIGDEIHAVEVQNISQRGLKAKLSCFVAPDREVEVRLNGLAPRKAIVRWTQFETAGMNFIRPLGFDELAEWVIRLQACQPGTASSGRRGRT